MTGGRMTPASRSGDLGERRDVAQKPRTTMASGSSRARSSVTPNHRDPVSVVKPVVTEVDR